MYLGGIGAYVLTIHARTPLGAQPERQQGEARVPDDERRRDEERGGDVEHDHARKRKHAERCNGDHA